MQGALDDSVPPMSAGEGPGDEEDVAGRPSQWQPCQYKDGKHESMGRPGRVHVYEGCVCLMELILSGSVRPDG